MKKIAAAVMLAAVALTLCGCSGLTSFIVFSRDTDSEKFAEIYDVEAVKDGEKVVFYANEEIYGVTVTLTEYDELSNSFSDVETLFELDTLKKGDGIRIAADFSREIPDVKVCYTRKNGKSAEQFLYKNPETGKLWLLERE